MSAAEIRVAQSVLVREAHRDRSREARGALGALRIAAEPEEVVGDPARQIALVSRQLHGRARRRKQAESLDRAARDDPRVLALAARTKRERQALRGPPTRDSAPGMT